MNYVLDACAMIAFLRGEPGKDIVRDILRDPSNHCFAHTINLCEVYYNFVRTADIRTARAALRDLSAVGIVGRRDMGRLFWMEVGRLKGTIQKISLADCFAIALSNRLGAEVVTSDHHEFDSLVGKGICRIRFIR